MKAKTFFLLSLFAATTAGAQDLWLQMDSVNGPAKSVCAAFTANGNGYVVSGLDFSGFTRKMYSYDPVQNDWDNEQSMGGANGGGLSRGSACAFAVNDKGYVCTGQGDNTNFLKDMWEYDPALDLWTQKADFPGTARRGAVSFVIDNIAYVGTGEDAGGLRKDFYRYDPVANLWGVIADFGGTARKQAVGFAMGYQGYVCTGDDGVKKKDLWQYLVFQNMWVQKANLPGPARSGAVGWAIFPNLYVATGEDLNSIYQDDVWEYNYYTNQWTQRASLPAPGRKNAIAFVIDNVAYLGTGYGADFYDDFYAYYGITGMQEATTGETVSCYPNPATDRFFIRMEEKGKMLPEFYSIDGRNVTSAFRMEENAGGYSVVVSNADAGVYLFRITTENGSTTGRIVIR